MVSGDRHRGSAQRWPSAARGRATRAWRCRAVRRCRAVAVPVARVPLAVAVRPTSRSGGSIGSSRLGVDRAGPRRARAAQSRSRADVGHLGLAVDRGEGHAGRSSVARG